MENPPSVASVPKFYSAVHVFRGQLRRVTIEAKDEAEAREIAIGLNVGLPDELHEVTEPQTVALAQAVAVDLRTACMLLGDISRGTIYRWLTLGYLERVPNFRKVLITRASIEKCAGKNIDSR